jgi:SPP1 gp7 family putative phage head morphogenesis protein
MSGCKTLNVVSEKEENHDTVNMSEPLVADTISDTITEEIAVVNEVKTDSLLSQDTVMVTVDTVVKNDTILIQPKTAPKEKESFVEDKIERTCSDSTIQDFRNNKIYYYGDAKVVYEDTGVKKVMWVAEKDHKTCGDCMEMDGEVFSLKDAPPKLHHNCRCYYIPVRE